MLALWRGCRPNMARAMVTTACQLVSYDSAKSFLLSHVATKDNVVSLLCTVSVSSCGQPIIEENGILNS